MPFHSQSGSPEELRSLILSAMRSVTAVRQRNEVIFRGELVPGGEKLIRDMKAPIHSLGGSFYTEEVNGKNFLIVTFPEDGIPRRKKWGFNLLLLLATIASTLFVGALLEGMDPSSDPQFLLSGIPFSITIIGILGLHELGHYFAARRYGLNVSLPYFIPFPTLLGTLGAFIKMRSSIHSRRMLLEIGAAGPILGLLASVPAVIYGLSLSTFQEIPPEGAEGISLGSSILFSAMERLVVGTPPEGQDLFLHPIAFAGWAGFFVTALNLLPIGQLDGGHVSYAMFGRVQQMISRIIFLALIPLGFFFWQGWLVWVVLIFLLIKIPHPPVVYEDVPLGRWQTIVGWAVILILLLTFIPAPIEVH